MPRRSGSGVSRSPLGLLAVTPRWPRLAPACRGKDLTHVGGACGGESEARGRLRQRRRPLVADREAGRRGLLSLRHDPLDGRARARHGAARGRADRRRQGRGDGARGPMDAIEKANVGAAMLPRRSIASTTHSRACAPKDRAPIEKLVAASGYPAEFAHHLKLWFLAILTATPPLRDEARRRAICPRSTNFWRRRPETPACKVIGLETPEEQIDASPRSGPSSAGDAARPSPRATRGLSDDVYATMLRLYRESRPADILRGRRYRRRHERERARGAGRVHAPSACRAATPRWPSAPSRSSSRAALSSPSARCTFPGRTGWWSAFAPRATRCRRYGELTRHRASRCS